MLVRAESDNLCSKALARSWAPANLRAPIVQLRGAMKKALVYRIGSLGDALVSLPALSLVAKHCPGWQLDLLTNHPVRQGIASAELVYGRTGLITETLHYPRSMGLAGQWALLKQLRAGKYDALYYLAPSRRSALQCLRDRAFFALAGIPKVYGARPLPMLRGIDNTEQGKEWFLVAKRLGLPMDGLVNSSESLLKDTEEGAAYMQSCKKEQPGHWVAICMGTQNPMRKWAVSNFEKVLKDIVERKGWVPVFFGGPSDVDEASEMIRKLGAGVNTCGNKLQVEAMRECIGYIGHDTGVMHLAAELGVRCVSIFASYQIKGRWLPRGEGHVNFLHMIQCAGCEKQTCPLGHVCCAGVDLITPEKVLESL